MKDNTVSLHPNRPSETEKPAANGTNIVLPRAERSSDRVYYHELDVCSLISAAFSLRTKLSAYTGIDFSVTLSSKNAVAVWGAAGRLGMARRP